jgi:hypothetical protein
MDSISFSLLSDGTSDRMLIRVIEWALRKELHDTPIQSEWADLRRFPQKPKSLAERIKAASILYPSDILFIHRDAERESHEARRIEIQEAVDSLGSSITFAAVIPIRMSEAWLLIDERAIRMASNNPNGSMVLDLPKLSSIESIADPKESLHKLLFIASDVRGSRRKKNFKADISRYVQAVAENISDYSLLERLSAFQFFQNELKSILALFTTN